VSGNGDCHGQISSPHFENRLKEKFISNIPQKSAAVFEYAPHRYVRVDKPPGKYAAKAGVISCLRRHEIACDATVIENKTAQRDGTENAKKMQD
jgi:hypothetical protein